MLGNDTSVQPLVTLEPLHVGLETVRREILVNPYHGSKTQHAIGFLAGFTLPICVGKKPSDSGLIHVALMLDMNALVPALDLAPEKSR